MPQPIENQGARVSRTTGKAPLSRAEAARHASLVRWGKEQPFQARLAAIREARKQKKAKGGKAPKAKKPTLTPEQRKAQRDEARQTEIDNNRTKVYDTLGISDGSIDAINALEAGEQPKDAAELLAGGLAEEGKDGTIRLTPTGREALHAADRGDVGAVRDAMSRGRDAVATDKERATAKQERDKAKSERETLRMQKQAEREKKLAEREKAQKQKAKAGGKQSSARVPSEAPQDKAAQKEQEKANNRTSVQQALEKSGNRSLNADAFDALASFADGEDSDPGLLEGLAVSTGLVEKDSTGGYRMTNEGRAYVTAASRGDVRGAGDAMSRALDRVEGTAEDTPEEDAPPPMSQREDTRRAATARRRAHTAKNQSRKSMTELLDELRETKAQTAQERAMFANMGSSGGGGGKGKDEGGKDAPKHDLNTPDGRTASALQRAGHPVSVLPHNDTNAGEFHGGRDATVTRLSKLSKSELDTLEKDTHDKWTNAASGPARDKLDRQAKRDFLQTREYQKQLIKDARAKQKENDVTTTPAAPKGKGKQKDDDGDDPRLRNLPQDLSQTTRAQQQALLDYHVNLSPAELRRRQLLNREQILSARDQLSRTNRGDPAYDRLIMGQNNLMFSQHMILAAQDKQERQQRKAKKSMDDYDYSTIALDLEALADTLAETGDLAIKAGARHSSSDIELIQQIYDSAEDLCEIAIALGATPMDEAEDEAEDTAEGGDVEMVEGKADDLAEMVFGGEIKALQDDAIGGFAVLFGDADNTDASAQKDYFTKSTDYWLDKFGWPRPMTYHHGLDEDTRDDPIVGTWVKAVVKPEGVWLEGQLDRAHRYHGAIKELIKRGYLKLSSDSAPQWVQRERQPNGANYVKRWPLLSASPTVTPAEPRMSGLSFKSLLAELGLENIDGNVQARTTDEDERADGLKVFAERKRALLLELDLLELEETAR